MAMGSTVRPVATPFQITIDCADAERMTAFWSVALGYVEEPPPAGYLSWEDFLRASVAHRVLKPEPRRAQRGP